MPLASAWRNPVRPVSGVSAAMPDALPRGRGARLPGFGLLG